MARQIPKESTPIMNKILEALAKMRLSTYEFNIIFAVIRQTYGWDKKEDWISGSQLSELTNMLPQHCYRTLKKLSEKNIIFKHGHTVGLNKHFETWIVPEQVLKIPKQVVPEQVLNPKVVVPAQVVEHTQTGTKNDTQAGTNQRNYKETITKETISESYDSLGIVPDKKGDGVNQIFDVFYDKINPTINYENSTSRKAAAALMKSFGFEKTWKLASLAVNVQGELYAPVITTPYELKEKLSKLVIHFKKEQHATTSSDNHFDT